MMKNSKIRLIVLGAGQRGHAYAQFVNADPENQYEIVAIAEPNDERRQSFAKAYSVPKDSLYTDYTQIAVLETPIADGVLICVQDSLHLECVRLFAGNYHLLCEKPMAQTQLACQEMHRFVSSTDKIFGMGHVLRYSPHNIALRRLLSDKVIGDVVSIEHTEPVGHAHFAHSYVRGNWRKQSESSFSLLTKSCHDIDLIQWLVGASSSIKELQPALISSSGSLQHFRKSRKPKEAGDAVKCLDCAYSEKCPYSAKSIYLDSYLRDGRLDGFRRALTDIEDVASIKTALQTTRYGSCVYELDNDVCDNQFVLLRYDLEDGPVNVCFNMIAFSQDQCVRKTTIYGSRGQINANGIDVITVHDFTTGSTQVHNIEDRYGARERSHAGGDHGLISQFVQAIRAVRDGRMNVAQAQEEYIGCTVDEMLISHEVVFAAERSRVSGSTLHGIDLK